MGEEVIEQYFDNFYRVVVVRDNGEYVVSVDVYYVGWTYGDHREVCIENTCLLMKELDASILRVNPCKSRKIIVIGTRLGSKAETINIKWICSEKPSGRELEELYRLSWIIARGETT
jgi:hypothetical protein